MLAIGMALEEVAGMFYRERKFVEQNQNSNMPTYLHGTQEKMVQIGEDIEEEMLEMAIVLSQGTEKIDFQICSITQFMEKNNWIKCDFNTIFDLCIVRLCV